MVILQVNWELVGLWLCFLLESNASGSCRSRGRRRSYHGGTMSHRTGFGFYWEMEHCIPTHALEKQAVWASLPSTCGEVNSPAGWSDVSYMAGTGTSDSPTKSSGENNSTTLWVLVNSEWHSSLSSHLMVLGPVPRFTERGMDLRCTLE